MKILMDWDYTIEYLASSTETIRGEGTKKIGKVQGKVKMSVMDDFKSGSTKIEEFEGPVFN